MIKAFQTILIVLLFFCSCNNNGNGLVIEGKIANLESSQVIASYKQSDTICVDTILADENGKFLYPHDVDTTTLFTLYFNNFHSSTIVFAEKGISKIKIKGDALLPDLIEIRGGKINEDLTSFKKENETLLEQRFLLLSKANYENDTLQNSGNLITEKERIAQINSLNHELSQKVEEFIIANPDNLSSVILINDFFKNNENTESLARVLDYLEGEALDFPLTYQLQNHIEKLKLSAEGSNLPYFKLTDINDEVLKSSDFKNKYLLLSFLSSNSNKSKENIEILKDEYENLNKDEVELLSIFIDSDSLPIQYASTDSIPWKVVVEDKSWSADIVDDLNVHYLPFNILINPKGEIITRDISIGEVKNIIDTTTVKAKS